MLSTVSDDSPAAEGGNPFLPDIVFSLLIILACIIYSSVYIRTSRGE